MSPPKAKSQARFMRLVASGKKKVKGLSHSQAWEYVDGHSTKNLPNKVRKPAKTHRKRK